MLVSMEPPQIHFCIAMLAFTPMRVLTMTSSSFLCAKLANTPDRNNGRHSNDQSIDEFNEETTNTCF